MQFKVRMFLGDELIAPSELQNVVIRSKTVDRIVNDAAERETLKSTVIKNSAKKSERTCSA